MLILLDIDGTLLHGVPQAHTEAMVRALEQVYGVSARAHDVAAVVPAGRTDQEIARLVLARHGVGDAAADAGMEDWMERCVALYPAVDAVLPGPVVAPDADGALARLAEVGAALALLTGNLEPIARAKMARAGLGEWFVPGQGAFGSDHERRDALVPIAVRRAGGEDMAPEPVVVGDTPRDIACARAGGARCVAVATGIHDAVDLAAADAVAHDLGEVADVLLAWLGAADPGSGAPMDPGGPAPG